SPVVREKARVSPFLQSWAPLQRKLPRSLKRLYKTAAKFNLKFDALALSKDVKEELPIWFHNGASSDLRRHNNTRNADCLRENHGVIKVGDVTNLINRNYICHSRRRNCACTPCKDDRSQGCNAPYKCQEEAIKILDCLNEKWDPRKEIAPTNPDLLPDERDKNVQALAEKEVLTFDPKVIMNGPSVDGYRIFCEDTSDTPAHQMVALDDEGEPSDETIFVGNSHKVNQDGEHISSGGIWYGQGDERNRTVRVPMDLASKESGKTAAVLYAIQNSPREASLHFKLD
ncbi:hypothetical protein B0H15DRAFT_762500, partial [Mycena belliarum]